MNELIFHHVGIGTLRFEQAIAAYSELGYQLVRSVDDPRINVKVAFLRAAHGPLLEILAPLGADGPLRGLIERKAVPGPYHTCYAVAELEAATEALRARGFVPISPAVPALAFDEHPVRFFYGRDVGVLELVENPPEM
jgi:methylmalonyl-CoA/ethylmalonyl-CoA epimerase